MEVVTFEGFLPPARYDGLPWTSVTIEEADTEDSETWTAIETIALSPLDADPADPASRSFTTALGTAPDLWYRIYFSDAAAAVSEPTVPLQNTAGASLPDVNAYATVSELARILKIRIPTTEQTTAMQRVLDAASLEIDREVGRTSPYSTPPALVVEVTLERAVEHWQQMESPFGIIGLGADFGATHTATDSWNRHANKLAALKETWGLA